MTNATSQPLPVAQELARVRRILHQTPEAGQAEHETQRFLLDYLSALPGIIATPCADTGVLAVLETGAAHTIAFRADMDALPVTEQTGRPFASKREGYMHACGHDGHMALALVLAREAAAHPERLTRNIRFLFQPAEESVGGAERMIAAGALGDAEEIYGFHVMPTLPAGTLGIAQGPLMARIDEFSIHLTGLCAHGAKPEDGKDALFAAAQLVLSIQSIITRSLNPATPAVFSIGRMVAGDKANIVAGHARLDCSVRTYSDEDYTTIRQRLEALLAGIEASYDISWTIQPVVTFPVVVNHPHTTTHALQAAHDLTVATPEKMMISEDFSFYQRQIPGTFIFLGSRDPDIGFVHPLHSDKFDFNEEILQSGVTLGLRLLRR